MIVVLCSISHKHDFRALASTIFHQNYGADRKDDQPNVTTGDLSLRTSAIALRYIPIKLVPCDHDSEIKLTKLPRFRFYTH